MITISRRFDNVIEYVLGEDGKPVTFDSVNAALRYLADRNFTLQEITQLDFNIE